jgi:DNA invertase Pin-like site-specific DNA recombinase
MNPGAAVLGYARVSLSEQAANGYGLASQDATIREECSRRGWTLLDLIHDEGASGRDTDRPGLKRALRRIADGEATGLVVSKLDRLSRSVVDFGMLLDWFDQAGATLVALDLGVDTSTPGGRLVANVFASVAEWERETIGARTRDGLIAARAKGRRISRPAVADTPKLKRRIERMRARGMTLQAIADKLNAEGVPTLRGAPRWRPSSVQAACGYRRPKPRRKPAELPRLRRRQQTTRGERA